MLFKTKPVKFSILYFKFKAKSGIQTWSNGEYDLSHNTALHHFCETQTSYCCLGTAKNATEMLSLKLLIVQIEVVSEMGGVQKTKNEQK